MLTHFSITLNLSILLFSSNYYTDLAAIRKILENEAGGSCCPSCKMPFDKGKKRKLIDTCGHAKCYSCMFKNESCTICANTHRHHQHRHHRHLHHQEMHDDDDIANDGGKFSRISTFYFTPPPFCSISPTALVICDYLCWIFLSVWQKKNCYARELNTLYLLFYYIYEIIVRACFVRGS